MSAKISVSERTQTQAYKEALARAVTTTQSFMQALPRAGVDAKSFHNLLTQLEAHTDLEAPDDQLSDDQLAWKEVHRGMHDQFTEAFGHDAVAIREAGVTKLRTLKRFHDALQTLLKHAFNIELSLVEIGALCSVHFEDRDTNEYLKNVDKLSRVAANDDVPPADRVGASTASLELTEYYKAQLITPLTNKIDLLHKTIEDYERTLRLCELPSTENEKDQFAVTENLKDGREWLILTRELAAAYIKAMQSIELSLQADKLIPELVIKNGGEPGEIDINDSFVHLLSGYGALRIEAYQQINAINPRREALTTRLYPELRTEVEERINATYNGNTTKEKKPWYAIW